MHEPFRRNTVQFLAPCGLRRMAYLEWGQAERVLLCVHGLTRCARDFDVLADALCDQYRVICPDMPGRGDSDWLRDPAGYAMPTYLSAVVALIARLGVDRVHWLGTSMGGLIGMALAALPDTPVARLVLNDVGPAITASALERIGAYVGAAPHFPNLEAAEQYVRAVCAPFGAHSDAQWRLLTEHALRPEPQGGYRMHYDPAIAVTFNAQQPHRDVDLWHLYDAIRCPILLLRGECSDLLAPETARQMAERGPRACVAQVKDVGHAPTLMHADQIALVRAFLLES